MLLGSKLGTHKVALFPHDMHVERLGEDSCAQCHHMSKPMDKNTACSECHRDMNKHTDLFNHEEHIQANGGNDSCNECHDPLAGEHSAENAAACQTCHADMIAKGAFEGSPMAAKAKEVEQMAPGYKTVMHRLCIGCHKDAQKASPDKFPADFARCDGCHRVSDETLKSLEPKKKATSMKMDEVKTAAVAGNVAVN